MILLLAACNHAPLWPDDAPSPGGDCAATAICHSAVDEHPIRPTLPFDQGWVDIHLMAS